MQETQALRSHRVRFSIAAEILAGYDGGRPPTPEVAAQRRARALQAARKNAANLIARASGHQVHPDEIQSQLMTATTPGHKRAVMHRWAPEAMGYATAELIGGPADGEIMNMQGPRPEVIRIADTRPLHPVFHGPDDPPPTFAPTRYHHYEYSGWNTETKRFPYRYAQAVGD